MRNFIILGIIAGIILLIVKFPHTMISPGELVEGHQKLNNDCFACHAPFGGIDNNKCIACHTLNKIGKSTLDSNNSNKGLFHEKLESQSCTTCHTDHDGVNPTTLSGGFKHNLLAPKVVNDCVSCHQKPTDKLHDQLSTTCKSCHNTDAWKSGVKFDHNMLVAADKNNCVSCHIKPADQLHAQLSNECRSCHNTDGWKSGATFNHNMLTATDKNNCVSCHQKPKDTFHAALKDNCNTCHSTDKWVPANFDHDSYFRLDRNHNASCTTCHKGKGYETYTCYGCHEHTVNNILSEHREEGISNINNCVSCHKSGNEHDIESGGSRNNNHDGKSKKKGREGEDDDD